MYSPTYSALPVISPARSTPSLDHDHIEYYSPPDDYLATPDLSEWKEVQKLEEQKMRIESESVGDVQFQYDLPSLGALYQDQRPLLSELPPQLPQWPYATIAPKDAFPDYAEVRRFLQEQARPSSPSAASSASSSSYLRTPYHDHDPLYDEDYPPPNAPYDSPLPHAEPTPSTSTASPTNATSPSSRRVGKKVKREEDDDYEPISKRRILASSSVSAHARLQFDADGESDGEENTDLHDVLGDDDESGDFRPMRRLPASRPKSLSSARGTQRFMTSDRRRISASAATRRTASHPKPKCNRGEVYQEGPCDCRDDKCLDCQMTCFYTFVHGQRKGEICKRLFESGRHLDLRRHKATHAVQEWKWLQDGEISPEVAHWHFVVFEGKEHGLICPNGDCRTTFTRYDALKRHMERGTCQYMRLESDKNGLDNRQVKARIMQESDEKYGRMTEAKHT